MAVVVAVGWVVVADADGVVAVVGVGVVAAVRKREYPVLGAAPVGVFG